LRFETRFAVLAFLEAVELLTLTSFETLVFLAFTVFLAVFLGAFVAEVAFPEPDFPPVKMTSQPDENFNDDPVCTV
jgi:hypothetical protein